MSSVWLLPIPRLACILLPALNGGCEAKCFFLLLATVFSQLQNVFLLIWVIRHLRWLGQMRCFKKPEVSREINKVTLKTQLNCELKG